MTLTPAELARLCSALRAGHVLACPTETQLGLLADARNEAAIDRIRAMKGRLDGHALPLIVPSLQVAEALACDIPQPLRDLAERYWPGPLTLVLVARPGLPAALLKDGTLALRVPGPSPALELCGAFGGPLTATSANLTGQAPLASAAAARAAFGAALHDVVPGNVPGGSPSTIVAIEGQELRVLRAGAIELAPS